MSVSKIVAAAASGVGGAGLDVDEVFSTFLYDGTGANLTITNGIDLSGEGGLVWIKSNQARANALFDTERGVGKVLISNESAAQANQANALTAFNSNGFSLGIDDSDNVNKNYTGNRMAAWTFRKAPKFFDVVTYTGDGTARTISHNLGSVPGMIIFKKTSGDEAWWVWHRSAGGIGYIGILNTNGSFFNAGTAVTAVSDTTLGVNYTVNGNGDSYVAYLFAHNNNDGGFGPSADQDIIKCGSYSGNDSTDGPTVNLGFEPQFVLIKSSTATYNWMLIDNMRGAPTGGTTAYLNPNKNEEENTASGNLIDFTSTGFKLKSGDAQTNNNETYIYMAIRRGSLNVPEDATKVFGVNYAYTYDVNGSTGGSSAQLVGYIGEPADLNIQGYRSGSSFNAAVFDRLRNNKYLITNTTSAETSISGNFWDNMAGFREVASGQDTTMIEWTWRRAPGYFDVVAYTGNTSGSATQNINHNLGVAPEMMWVKKRNGVSGWEVYHSALGNTKAIRLDENGTPITSVGWWNNTTPTASVFSVGTADWTNASGDNFIAYLFATVAGVSKVGSFSHTNGGGDTNVDCGFSSGARLVIYKRTDDSSSWYIFDSVRGIVSGSGDAQLELNSTGAENTSFDLIDPYSTGFKIPSNATGTGDYIFYAIA